MADYYTDGAIKLHPQLITGTDSAGVTNKTWKLKSGSLSSGVNRQTDTDEYGVENAQSFQKTIPTGSLTLGFVAAADKPPQQLQAVGIVDTTGSTITVIIGEVDDTFGPTDPSTVTVKIYKKQA